MEERHIPECGSYVMAMGNSTRREKCDLGPEEKNGKYSSPLAEVRNGREAMSKCH